MRPCAGQTNENPKVHSPRMHRNLHQTRRTLGYHRRSDLDLGSTVYNTAHLSDGPQPPHFQNVRVLLSAPGCTLGCVAWPWPRPRKRSKGQGPELLACLGRPADKESCEDLCST
eukprot:6747431-Pyramimonas_sp.AAC.1